jgi:GT2 family glycosyltransferase
MTSSEQKIKKVALIVLNYNSWRDTLKCVSLCVRQLYANFLVIVVDNASTDDSVEKMKAEWRSQAGIKYVAEYDRRDAEAGGTEEKENALRKYGPEEKLVLIKNDRNLGYSAGNNVGIRYALKKKAAAVLIVNPDVRIDEPSALGKMIAALLSRDDIAVVGPNITDAEGRRQSPLREPSFWEECFGPFMYGIAKRFGGRPFHYIEPVRSHEPFEVYKVAGSCMLIRSSFLQNIGLLDEHVFLYCEEPILSAAVYAAGGRLLFVPRAPVIHTHDRKRKGSQAGRMQMFIKSRKYYLKSCSGYKGWRLASLFVLYAVLAFFYRIKNKLS